MKLLCFLRLINIWFVLVQNYTHGLLDFPEKLCYNTGKVRTETVGSDLCKKNYYERSYLK